MLKFDSIVGFGPNCMREWKEALSRGSSGAQFTREIPRRVWGNQAGTGTEPDPGTRARLWGWGPAGHASGLDSSGPVRWAARHCAQPDGLSDLPWPTQRAQISGFQTCLFLPYGPRGQKPEITDIRRGEGCADFGSAINNRLITGYTLPSTTYGLVYHHYGNLWRVAGVTASIHTSKHCHWASASYGCNIQVGKKKIKKTSLSSRASLQPIHTPAPSTLPIDTHFCLICLHYP